MPNNLPIILTPLQAADMLQTSEKFVKDNAVELGVVYVGRKLRFEREFILEWFRNQRQAQTQPVPFDQTEIEVRSQPWEN